MADDSYTFAQARARLDEIVVQVRKKDTSLEKSLDLLEEGVRLANQCTELIDHADWEAAGAPDRAEGPEDEAEQMVDPGAREAGAEDGSTPEMNPSAEESIDSEE